MTKTLNDANAEAAAWNQRYVEACRKIERLQRYVTELEAVADSHGLQVAQARLRAAEEPGKQP